MLPMLKNHERVFGGTEGPRPKIPWHWAILCQLGSENQSAAKVMPNVACRHGYCRFGGEFPNGRYAKLSIQPRTDVGLSQFGGNFEED